MLQTNLCQSLPIRDSKSHKFVNILKKIKNCFDNPIFIKCLDYQQHKKINDQCSKQLQLEINRNGNYREIFVRDLKYNTNYIVSSIFGMINITMHAWHAVHNSEII